MPSKRNKGKAGKAKGKARKAKAKGTKEEEREEVKEKEETATEQKAGKKSSGLGDAIHQQEDISLAQELSRMLLVDVRDQGKKELSESKQAVLAEIVSGLPEERQRSIHQFVGGAIAEKRDAEKRAAMSALGYSDEQQALLDDLFANDSEARDHMNKLAIRDAALLADAVVAAQHLELTFTNPSTIACMHGFGDSPYRGAYDLVKSFYDELIAGKDRGDVAKALIATMSKYAEVWVCDPTISAVRSYFLWLGTERILTGKEYTPNMCAYVVCIIEQVMEYHRAGLLGEGDIEKDLNTWLAKAHDLITANDRALISFFRHRISCKCLEEKHEENKGQTKTSICYNDKCTHNLFERVEKSKTMCCSRCRAVNYCSRECQVADWPRHKTFCQKIQNK